MSFTSAIISKLKAAPELAHAVDKIDLLAKDAKFVEALDALGKNLDSADALPGDLGASKDAVLKLRTEVKAALRTSEMADNIDLRGGAEKVFLDTLVESLPAAKQTEFKLAYAQAIDSSLPPVPGATAKTAEAAAPAPGAKPAAATKQESVDSLPSDAEDPNIMRANQTTLEKIALNKEKAAKADEKVDAFSNGAMDTRNLFVDAQKALQERKSFAEVNKALSNVTKGIIDPQTNKPAPAYFWTGYVTRPNPSAPKMKDGDFLRKDLTPEQKDEGRVYGDIQREPLTPMMEQFRNGTFRTNRVMQGLGIDETKAKAVIEANIVDIEEGQRAKKLAEVAGVSEDKAKEALSNTPEILAGPDRAKRLMGILKVDEAKAQEIVKANPDLLIEEISYIFENPPVPDFGRMNKRFVKVNGEEVANDMNERLEGVWLNDVDKKVFVPEWKKWRINLSGVANDIKLTELTDKLAEAVNRATVAKPYTLSKTEIDEIFAGTAEVPGLRTIMMDEDYRNVYKRDWDPVTKERYGALDRKPVPVSEESFDALGSRTRRKPEAILKDLQDGKLVSPRDIERLKTWTERHFLEPAAKDTAPTPGRLGAIKDFFTKKESPFVRAADKWFDRHYNGLISPVINGTKTAIWTGALGTVLIGGGVGLYQGVTDPTGTSFGSTIGRGVLTALPLGGPYTSANNVEGNSSYPEAVFNRMTRDPAFAKEMVEKYSNPATNAELGALDKLAISAHLKKSAEASQNTQTALSLEATAANEQMYKRIAENTPVANGAPYTGSSPSAQFNQQSNGVRVDLFERRLQAAADPDFDGYLSKEQQTAFKKDWLEVAGSDNVVLPQDREKIIEKLNNPIYSNLSAENKQDLQRLSFEPNM